MALYIGSSNTLRILLKDGKFILNIPTPIPTDNNIRLLSLDNYTLKDFNNLYLVAKEAE